jgi:fumarylpyruvate hydrolase
MSYVLEPSAITAVPVKGEDGAFPVRRVFCVGRNYADHVREMGGDPSKGSPIFFTKPSDAIVPVAEGSIADIPYPPGTNDLHHEVELVVAIGKKAQGVSAADAMDHVYGYAVGIDFTRRDLQTKMKNGGKPWDIAKAFDCSGPCGPITKRDDFDLSGKAITLSVNGEVRQSGNLDQMIWSVPEVIESLSSLFTLMPGDLIFTGTPDGVGPVQRGDNVNCKVDDLMVLKVKIL